MKLLQSLSSFRGAGMFHADSIGQGKKSDIRGMFSLRGKLFAGFIVFNLIMSPLLGVILYRAAITKFFDSFCENKLSIARILSTAINGDIHQRLAAPESIKIPEYRYYLDLISTVRKKEKDIRYIHTVNYNRADGKLYYAIDGNIPQYDTLWFETNELAFNCFIDKQSRMTVEYDGVLHTGTFDISSSIGRVRVGFSDKNGRRQILVNGVPMIVVMTEAPLSAATPAGTVSRTDYFKQGPVTVNGKSLTLSVSYTAGGMPSSWPGAEFIETREFLDKLKKLIDEKRDYVDRESVNNAYGKFYSAYSTIINRAGKGVGIILVVVSSREVDQYRRGILNAAIILFLAAFIVSLIVTVYLSRYFTAPLSKLMRGVSSLAEGDMNALVDIRSRDEFGGIAERFNEMAARLKDFSEEQQLLIKEIRELNEGLEKRVVERTLTIEEQSSELNRQIMMARRIQMSLLPSKMPETGNVSISFKYKPMMGVGGDFIDFNLQDDNLMLFICDVSGHGVPAAFLSAMVKMSLPSCYDAAGRTSLAVKRLHESLKGKMGGHFISAVFCHIDHQTGVMTCSSAGHPPLIIVRRDGSVEYGCSEGRIISENFPPNSTEAVTLLQTGDKLVLYTDGITEARNRDLVMYGEEKLDQIVRRHVHQSAAEMCESIYQSVLAHISGTSPEFEDDITLMVAEYTG